MNQFNPETKDSLSNLPEMAEGLLSEELNKLRKDVLHQSVDDRKESVELVKVLKEVAPVAAVLIIGMIVESFKEKEEETRESKESKKDKSKAVVSLAEDKEPEIKTEEPAEDGEQAEAKEEKKEEAVPESVEVLNASDLVIIGDSIPKGMISRFEKGKKPDFIGEKGKSTPNILGRVKNNRDKLKNKKTAIISCGLNDLVWTDDYEEIVYRIDEMVKECEKAKIEEIIVLTGFPFQSDFKKTKLRVRSRGFREVILKRFREPRVKVVDLYKHFADEEGDLKKRYATRGRDKLHPYKAYKEALRIIGRESESDIEKLIS